MCVEVEAVTAPNWPSSAGARAWVSDRQVLERSWHLAPAQKGTQFFFKGPKYTKRRHNNKDEEVNAQGKDGKEHNINPLGTAGDWAAGQGCKGGGGGCDGDRVR